MNANLEKEYKVLVTKEEMNQLKKQYPPEEEMIQRNIYFDTDDHALFQRHIMVRIREIDERLLFTAKIRQSNHASMEYEAELTNRILSEQPQVIAFLQEHNIDVTSLKEQGSLITHRWIYNDLYGELCFDQNEYNETVDYEIEYEEKFPCEDFFHRFLFLLSKADINYQPATPKMLRCLGLASPHTNN